MGFSCTICTEDLVEDLAVLKCGHTYHSVCVHQWLEHKKKCPNCQTTVKLNDIRPLFLGSCHDDEADAADNNSGPKNATGESHRATLIELQQLRMNSQRDKQELAVARQSVAELKCSLKKEADGRKKLVQQSRQLREQLESQYSRTIHFEKELARKTTLLDEARAQMSRQTQVIQAHELEEGLKELGAEFLDTWTGNTEISSDDLLRIQSRTLKKLGERVKVLAGQVQDLNSQLSSASRSRVQITEKRKFYKRLAADLESKLKRASKTKAEMEATIETLTRERDSQGERIAMLEQMASLREESVSPDLLAPPPLISQAPAQVGDQARKRLDKRAWAPSSPELSDNPMKRAKTVDDSTAIDLASGDNGVQAGPDTWQVQPDEQPRRTALRPVAVNVRGHAVMNKGQDKGSSLLGARQPINRSRYPPSTILGTTTTTAQRLNRPARQGGALSPTRSWLRPGPAGGRLMNKGPMGGSTASYGQGTFIAAGHDGRGGRTIAVKKRANPFSTVKR